MSEHKETSVQDEDDDVAAERQRIYREESKTDILWIRDLSKANLTDTHTLSTLQFNPNEVFNVIWEIWKSIKWNLIASFCFYQLFIYKHNN